MTQDSAEGRSISQAELGITNNVVKSLSKNLKAIR